MADVTYAARVSLETTTCWKCSGVYAMSEEYLNRRRKDGKVWHCPYCQAGAAFCESENDLLRKQLQAKNREAERSDAQLRMVRDQRDTAERQRNAQKAAKTRVMNRIKRGECPCCGKTFADLHEHMATKHPDYAEKQP